MLYTGNIWQGKILANHTGKSYWRGKIWQATVSAYAKYIISVSVNYWRGKFWRINHDSSIFSPIKIFPCTVQHTYTHTHTHTHTHAHTHTCTHTHNTHTNGYDTLIKRLPHTFCREKNVNYSTVLAYKYHHYFQLMPPSHKVLNSQILQHAVDYPAIFPPLVA